MNNKTNKKNPKTKKNMILLIFASQVARITIASHCRLAKMKILMRWSELL
jgi:hypothetical protein